MCAHVSLRQARRCPLENHLARRTELSFKRTGQRGHSNIYVVVVNRSAFYCGSVEGQVQRNQAGYPPRRKDQSSKRRTKCAAAITITRFVCSGVIRTIHSGNVVSLVSGTGRVRAHHTPGSRLYRPDPVAPSTVRFTLRFCNRPSSWSTSGSLSPFQLFVRSIPTGACGATPVGCRSHTCGGVPVENRAGCSAQ